jgi:hypothetical protein
MSRARKKRPCRGCRRPTRGTPTVSRDGDDIHVEGLGVLDHQAALVLAWRIADLLAP